MEERRSEERGTVTFRATEEQRIRWRKLALDHRMTLQDFVEHAILRLERELTGDQSTTDDPLSVAVQVPKRLCPTIQGVLGILVNPRDEMDRIHARHITEYSTEYSENIRQAP